jgi:hypothetical protein
MRVTKEEAERLASLEPWEDPTPFEARSTPPRFPTEALPETGRRFVEVLADVHQVDPGLPATTYLAVISMCRIQDQVNLKTHVEPCSIYTAAVLDSGERKSAVMSELIRPVSKFQKQLQELSKDTVTEAHFNRMYLEKMLNNAMRRATNLKSDAVSRNEAKEEARGYSMQLDSAPKAVLPQIFVTDTTPEALAVIMQDNNEQMSFFDSEGGMFKNMSGKAYGTDANFDIFLKAHSGDHFHQRRIGRPPVDLVRPALVMCLLVQNDVLDEIGKNKQFRGRGLLARFLWVICKSMIGYRERTEKIIPPELEHEYEEHITYLLKQMGGMRVMELLPEANELWRPFYNDTEKTMLPEGVF